MGDFTPFEKRVLAIYIVYHAVYQDVNRARVCKAATTNHDMNATYTGKVYDRLAKEELVGRYYDIFDTISENGIVIL